MEDNIQNYSFSRYTMPIKTGLKTYGQSSYLNSVLYCLGNIRQFASYFLNPKHQEYINAQIQNRPLSYVVERLLTHLYPFPEREKKEIYDLNAFFKVLGKLNKIYNTLQRRDPNELIGFILTTLHNELNKIINPNLVININYNDKKNVIKNGIKLFKNSENSMISNHFNWFEIKKLKCTECNNKSYDLKTFNTFTLDFENSYNNVKNQKNNLTIYDCLTYHKITHQRNLFCKNCNNLKKMDCNCKILSSPINFVFSVDRGGDYFEDTRKLQSIPFVLNDKIQLENFIDNESAPKNYELIGMVSISINEKKYVSICNSPVDNNWYLYNDENSGQVDITNIIKKHNDSKELIPSILIYQAHE